MLDVYDPDTPKDDPSDQWNREQCCCLPRTQLTLITVFVILTCTAALGTLAANGVEAMKVVEVAGTADDTLKSSNSLLQEVKASRITSLMSVLSSSALRDGGRWISDILYAATNGTKIIFSLEKVAFEANLTGKAQHFAADVEDLQARVDGFLGH